MPQSRIQTNRTTTTESTTPTTSVTNAAAVDNSLMADLLAGRARVDGDAAQWFSRGVTLQRGMKGDVIRQLQEWIGTGADGDFGPGTERAVKSWQKKNGFAETGVIDQTQYSKAQEKANRGGLPQGEEAFAEMWEAHPHNYLPEGSEYGENTSSGDLQESLGWDRNQFGNTCAIRLSTMLNAMGGNYKITTEKARAAGLDKMRSGGLYMPRAKNAETGAMTDRAILSAKEMWTYLEHTMGPPTKVFPGNGRNLKRADAQVATQECKDWCTGKKGFICFDNMQLQDENGNYTGYGGSGHVDIFDGQQLSDGSFYDAQRILVWQVA